jgi:hypothetical protein
MAITPKVSYLRPSTFFASSPVPWVVSLTISGNSGRTSWAMKPRQGVPVAFHL